MAAPRPWNLIAELTYRCPLRCPYCSNPTDHAAIRDGLDADAWGRVFAQAAALGCVHAGLTGGEPSARRDLDAIVGRAAAAGLYVHLVTAGLPLRPEALPALRDAGLRSVQLSIQDAEAAASDALAGTESFARKLAVARAVRAAGLALTINVVLHRRNLERRQRAEGARSGAEPGEGDPVAALVALARELDADRLELAHVQYDGWRCAIAARCSPRVRRWRPLPGPCAPSARAPRAPRSCSCCPTGSPAARSRAWAAGAGACWSWPPTVWCCPATRRAACRSSSGTPPSAACAPAGRTRRA
jgi:pyruvate-formate lyase-activating enzyme